MTLLDRLHDAVLAYASTGSSPSISVEIVGTGSQPPTALTPYAETLTLAITIAELGTTTLEIAYNPALTTKRGVFGAFYSGHGTSWWTGGGGASTALLLEDHRAMLLEDGRAFLLEGRDGSAETVDEWLDNKIRTLMGRDVVLYRWVTGWDNRRGTVDPDNPVPGPGPAACAAFGAVAVAWTRARYCTDVDDLRITGNSAGGSLLSYLFKFYGLGGTGLGDEAYFAIKRGVVCSGPPHAGLLEGCIGLPFLNYNDDTTEGPDNAAKIDDAYGFKPDVVYGDNVLPGGPATRNDASQDPGWSRDSVENGRYYRFSALLAVIDGGKDEGVAPLHGNFLVRSLDPAPVLRWSGSSGHALHGNAEGRAAILSAMFDDPIPPGLRQQAISMHEQPATEFAAAFPFPRGSNSLVIAGIGCSAAAGAVPDLDGFKPVSDDFPISFGGRSLTVWEATDAVTEMILTFASTVGGTAVLMEIDGGSDRHVPFIDVIFAGEDNGSPAMSYEIGPTEVTRMAAEFAVAFLANSGGNYSGTWTNEYLEAIAGGYRLSAATKVLDTKAAQDTTEGFHSSVRAAGALVTIGRDPLIIGPTVLELLAPTHTRGELVQ